MKHGRFGTNHELGRALDVKNSGPEKYFYPGSLTFGFEHPQNVVCRPVAEKLSSRFLVIGDVMFFEQSNEVCRCIPCQCGFREVWICGYEVFRLAVDVGEVAAASTGNEDLLASAIRVLNHGDTAPTFAGLRRAH